MSKTSLLDRFPEYQERFRADILAELYRNERSAMAGHFLVALLSVGFTYDAMPRGIAIAWISAVLVGVMFRGILHRRYSRRPRHDARDLKLHTLGISACALGWSLGFVLASPYLDESKNAFYMMVFAGITASAVITLSGRVKSYSTFSGLILGPPIITLMVGPNPDIAIATMALAMLAFCGVGVRKANSVLQAAMLRRYQNTDIMRDLAKAKKSMEKEAQRAEAANLAKQEFLANVSHEIRTPMNGILGMTDIVLQSKLDEDQRECLATAHRCGTSLLTLIDDLLDFSKIEAGRMEVESIPFELRPLAEDLLQLHRNSGKAKVPIRLELDPGLPQRILGDPLRLRQVVNNLLGNAVKFTSRGEIRLRLLVSMEDKEMLQIRVEDDGIGIPPDRLDSIFESFTQADGSTTRNFGGTGLGLTITRSLCELMEGRLEVESMEGRGSTFHLHLPLVDPDHDRLSRESCFLFLDKEHPQAVRVLENLQVPHLTLPVDGDLWNEGRNFFARHGGKRFAVIAAAAGQEEQKLLLAFAKHFHLTLLWHGEAVGKMPEERFGTLLPDPFHQESLEELLQESTEQQKPDTAAAEDAQPLRILVAEDHPTNATIVRRMLEALGHEVTIAVDGQIAFETFRDQGADLVLMDLQMPNMGGHDSTRAIRALPDGRQVPIVALTAHAAQEERERSLSAGMDDLLTKPFTRDQLLATLAKWGHHSHNHHHA